MKNTVKKMKWAIMALGLLLGLGLGLTLRADIKYFWLDHPTGRTNPNDPLSPLYKSPTAVGPVGTASDTPTISPTPTDTPSVSPANTSTFTDTASPSDTPSATPTDTPYAGSATYTPTATPTATMTSTPQAAGWPTVYGSNGAGGVVPLGGNGYTAGGTDGFNQLTGSEPGGVGYYQDVTLSCAAAGYSAGAVFSTGFSAPNVDILQNATAYTAVSITVAIPPIGTAGNPSLIVPGLSLVYQLSAPNTTQTAIVNLDSFVVGGPQFMQPSASTSSLIWYTAVVPISVFEQLCNTNGVTPTAAYLQNVVGVEVQPANYGNTGAITTEIYVDGISFVNASNSTAPTGLTGNDFSGLFSDFEDGTGDNWGAYWSTNVDSFTAADCSGYVAPPGSPNLSSVIYGGVTDTVSAADATGDPTPSHAAHFSGYVGDFNGTYGNPACSNANAFPYLNMTASMNPITYTPEDLSSNGFVSTFPNTGTPSTSGAGGISVLLELGPNSSSSQVYGVAVGSTYTAGTGNLWYFQVAATSLSQTQWTQYIVPFPPDGSVNPAGAGGTNGTLGESDFTHADQGSTGTEAWWGQTQYGTYVPFTRNALVQVEIEAIVRGLESDLYVDDVQFYGNGQSPAAAVRNGRAVRVVRGL